MNTLLKAPTKAEVEVLIEKRDLDFAAAIPVLKDKCIEYINEYLKNYNWGVMKRLNYGAPTVEIPFDVFRDFRDIDPMTDLPYEVLELLKPELDDAGYYVFASTGSKKALYITLTPKEIKQ